MVCSKCGKEVGYKGKFCIHCGEVIPEQSMEQEVIEQHEFEKQPVPLRKKRFVLPAIAAVSVLAVLLCVILLKTTLVSGGFYTESMAALNKTLKSEGFDFNFSVSEGEDVSNLVGSIQFQLDEREISFHITSSEDGTSIALYDGYLFELDESGDVYDYVDCTKEMKLFWELYEKSIKGLEKIEDLDLEAMLSEFTESIDVSVNLSPFIDFDQLKNCLKKFVAQWEDKKYLEEKYSYQKEKGENGTTYSFDINTQTLLKEVVNIFEPAVLMLSALDYSLMPENTIKFSITKDDGYLSALNLTILTEYASQQFNLTFENMKNPSINLEELKRYRSSVK